MTSALDPRTPVIVGAAQVSRRPTGLEDLNDALSLMIEATRLAAVDSGASSAVESLLGKVESIRVVESLGWRSPNPGAAIASELKLAPRDLVVTATGGNGPLSLLHDTCLAVQRGELDAALLVGAEAFYSRRVARAHEARAPEPATPAGPAARVLGDPLAGSHAAELEVGLALPTQVYPLFSTALQRAEGESSHELHRREAALWSRFSHVAASNPFAWSSQPYSPEEIASTSPDNRMISYPYTKRCCANIQVDQSAAVLLMSAEAAESAGVARDRWVFPWAGADAHDHWFVSERERLGTSPAVRECWKTMREMTSVDLDDISQIDLYSCFPSATIIAASELGLDLDDDDRPLTLTGGLPFAGGPGNNYSMHSLATLVAGLRDDPGIGLVTGVGWFMTKHALSLFGSEPPPKGFRHGSSPQQRVDAQPKRPVITGNHPDLALEAFTVAFDREGEPMKAIMAGLSPDGARGWLTSENPDVMAALMSDQEIVLADGALS